MVTVDPPLIALPTLAQIWRAANMDRAVAITAIVTAGVVLVALIAGLVLIVSRGGDVAAVSLAIGSILTAGVTAWAKLRSRGGNTPE